MAGEPVQQIGAAAGIDLPVIDISEITESQRDDAVQRIAAELRERSFDLRERYAAKAGAGQTPVPIPMYWSR